MCLIKDKSLRHTSPEDDVEQANIREMIDIVDRLVGSQFSHPGWVNDANRITKKIAEMDEILDAILERGLIAAVIGSILTVHVQLRHFGLELLTSIIYKSQRGFREFVGLNPVHEILAMLSDSESSQNVRFWILNVILKLVESGYATADAEIMDQVLLTFEMIPELAYMYVKIIDGFVRNSREDDIRPFGGRIVEKTMALWNSEMSLQMCRPIIAILNDVCAKGFVAEVIGSCDTALFIHCLHDERYKKCYGQIARLLAGFVTFNADLIGVIPLDWFMNALGGGLAKREMRDVFVLLTAVASQGLLLRMLDGNVAALITEDTEFETRELVLTMVWKGFIGLRTIEERIQLINSDMFIAMATLCPLREEMHEVIACLVELTGATYRRDLSERTICLIREFIDEIGEDDIDEDLSVFETLYRE